MGLFSKKGRQVNKGDSVYKIETRVEGSFIVNAKTGKDIDGPFSEQLARMLLRDILEKAV